MCRRMPRSVLCHNRQGCTERHNQQYQAVYQIVIGTDFQFTIRMLKKVCVIKVSGS